MNTKSGRILSVLLCFMLSTVMFIIGPEVSAEDENIRIGDMVINQATPGAGDPADYKIDGRTVVRAIDSSSGGDSLDFVAIGFNAGSSLPTLPGATNSSFGNVLVGRNVGRNIAWSRHGTYVGAEILTGIEETTIPTVGNGNTLIGAKANKNGNPLDYNTIVGFFAGEKNSGMNNTFLGTEAGRYVTTGNDNIMIGLNAGQGHERVGDYHLYFGGRAPVDTGAYNIFLGTDTEAMTGDLSSTIVIGAFARAEGSNQMVLGSGQFQTQCDAGAINCEEVKQCAQGKECYQYNQGLFTESYWGSGVTSVDPQPFSFNASGGSGPDTAGADLIIAGGKSTGIEDGGSIIFKTSPAGTTSNNIQNDPEVRMTINSDGHIGIGKAPSNSFWIALDALNKRGMAVTATMDQDGVVSADILHGMNLKAEMTGSATGDAYGLNMFATLSATSANVNSLGGGLFNVNFASSSGGTTFVNKIYAGRFDTLLNPGDHNYSVLQGYGVDLILRDNRNSGSGSLHFDEFKNININDAANDFSALSVDSLSGIWIEKQTEGTTMNYGIVLNGDSSFSVGNHTDLGAAIVFGSDQCCKIYAQGGALKAADAAGNVTQFSPHDPNTGEWIFYSHNVKTGRTVRVNMEELVKDMEKLTGKKYLIESFVKDN